MPLYAEQQQAGGWWCDVTITVHVKHPLDTVDASLVRRALEREDLEPRDVSASGRHVTARVRLWVPCIDEAAYGHRALARAVRSWACPRADVLTHWRHEGRPVGAWVARSDEPVEWSRRIA